MIKSNRSHLSVLVTMAFIALTFFHAVPARGASTPPTTAQLQDLADFVINAQADPPAAFPPSRISGINGLTGDLLSALPTGYTHGNNQPYDPTDSTVLLQHTCYLQDNVLYAIKALSYFTTAGTNPHTGYVYQTGAAVSANLITFYNSYYPTYDPNNGDAPINEPTLNYCTVGVYHALMASLQNTNQYYHFTSSSNIVPGLLNDSPPYAVETDYHVRPYVAYSLGANPKNLLKYGCLLEMVLYNHYTNIGDTTDATVALADAKNDFVNAVTYIQYSAAPNYYFEGFNEGNGTTYDTRDLAYFLLCERALDDAGQSSWVNSTGDPNYTIGNHCQTIIWGTCWDTVSTTVNGTGGMWDAYIYNIGGTYTLADAAKMENEISSVVLLDNEPFIWTGFTYTGPGESD